MRRKKIMFFLTALQVLALANVRLFLEFINLE
ncbi:hypothetical protein CF65_00910 [Aggregatibacter actinomycetemcomitans HK1651]|nr:hypothetical protein CF65_00910 [Aggregatibacter actinomycetemcomitans HK1651]